MADDRFDTLSALWSVRDDRTLGAGEQRVLLMLIAFADKSGACHPSVSRLAAASRMREQAVRASLQTLETVTGPVRVKVIRNRRTERGDPDTHAYELSPGTGWVRRGDRDATSRDPDTTLGFQSAQGVGSRSVGGGVIGHPEEDRKKTDQEDTEGKPAREEAPTKGSRKRQRGIPETALPPDWQPTEAHRTFASEHRLELELELVAFKGHFEGKTAASWNGRFSTWLANQAKWNRQRAPAPGLVQHRQRQADDDETRRVIRNEIIERGRSGREGGKEKHFAETNPRRYADWVEQGRPELKPASRQPGRIAETLPLAFGGQAK